MQSPEGLHHDELRIIHVWSQMMVADEFKGMTQYTTLTFIEFMEALGRISDVKDLASHVRTCLDARLLHKKTCVSID